MATSLAKLFTSTLLVRSIWPAVIDRLSTTIPLEARLPPTVTTALPVVLSPTTIPPEPPLLRVMVPPPVEVPMKLVKRLSPPSVMLPAALMAPVVTLTVPPLWVIAPAVAIRLVPMAVRLPVSSMPPSAVSVKPLLTPTPPSLMSPAAASVALVPTTLSVSASILPLVVVIAPVVLRKTVSAAVMLPSMARLPVSRIRTSPASVARPARRVKLFALLLKPIPVAARAMSVFAVRALVWLIEPVSEVRLSVPIAVPLLGSSRLPRLRMVMSAPTPWPMSDSVPKLFAPPISRLVPAPIASRSAVIPPPLWLIAPPPA